MVFLGFGAALLAYPAQVQRGLAQSVLYCLASLVPSLFPFMVLSSLIVWCWPALGCAPGPGRCWASCWAR